SFGTGKVGDLAGFASALVLAVIAIGIGGESVWRLASPSTVDFGEAIPIAIVGLIVNIVSALLLMEGHHGHEHAHGHAHHGHEAHGHVHQEHHDHHGHHGHHHDGHDNNLRSAYLHVVADALTSVLAIAALLAGLYLGWTWLDPLM
ncbi:cation diffusion facilitator family transporter, partial [Herbaspirillum sp. B65]